MFALSAAFLAAPQANAQSPDPALLAPGQSGRMSAPRYPVSRPNYTPARHRNVFRSYRSLTGVRLSHPNVHIHCFGIGVDLGAPRASQANHQSPDRGTVDCPQIDRPARAAAGTEDIEPRRPGLESGPDGGRIGPRTRSAAPTPPTRRSFRAPRMLGSPSREQCVEPQQVKISARFEE
jgi:hypothetical protein